jgi:hypothetical protein
MADKKIATLSPEEDARWIELFTDKLNGGDAEDIADEETFNTMQEEFPRLKDFDSISDATYI